MGDGTPSRTGSRNAYGPTMFRTSHWARFVPMEGTIQRTVVYLSPADKYPRLTRRLSQEQKGLHERARMASQRPSEPW
jgi:hypothetical protein